jgi:hypothetical protein
LIKGLDIFLKYCFYNLFQKIVKLKIAKSKIVGKKIANKRKNNYIKKKLMNK